MPSLPTENPMSNFSRGFAYPYRSLRFLREHPRLLRYILIPFLLNLVIFSFVVYLGLDFFDGTVVEYLPAGDAWYWVILYYAAWVLAVLVTAVLVFFTFTVVGNLLASPFNEILSERTEQVFGMSVGDEPFTLRGFISDARRVLVTELKKLLFFVFGMMALLLLNLIPVAGQVIYSVAAILFTLFFLVMEYLGYVFERKKFAFREQRRYIFGRKFLLLGFGTGVFCLLAVPFLQFFCLPLAVIGATLLWCEQAGGGSFSAKGNQ